MKKANILKGLSALMIAGAMQSCSSDYLDVAPSSEVSNKDVTTTATGIRLATYGIFKQMYCQYDYFYGFRWFNGEPWFSMVYGEVTGQDYISLFWQRSSNTIVSWDAMTQDTYTADAIAWNYLYGLIGQCNNILSGLEEDLTGEVAFRAAQAYTMRAHAYTRLLQVYGPRWADSSEGKAPSVVLRTNPADPEDVNSPLASMNEVLSLIYKDLDKAIALYGESGMSRKYLWETDMQIAKGIYARAALLKNDYQKAQTMAKEAREGYPVMSANAYETCGFTKQTSETMWATSDDYAGIYYAGFGSSYACNGAYPRLWMSIGAGAINLDLYNKMDAEKDVRAKLFFTPDKVDAADRGLFWDSKCVSSATGNVNVDGTKLQAALQEFCDERYAATGAANGWIAPYSVDGAGNLITTPDDGAVTTQFGAQFKFWAIDDYGSSSFTMMRGSELLLIEAEAACHNGDEATAKNCLDELNANRIEGYTATTASGSALLDEVKIARRLELWGEGFSWFDYKRWNEPIERQSWAAGDPNSGNWPALMAKDFGTDVNNGWRWVIPRKETEYNQGAK